VEEDPDWGPTYVITLDVGASEALRINLELQKTLPGVPVVVEWTGPTDIGNDELLERLVETAHAGGFRARATGGIDVVREASHREAGGPPRRRHPPQLLLRRRPRPPIRCTARGDLEKTPRRNARLPPNTRRALRISRRIDALRLPPHYARLSQKEKVAAVATHVLKHAGAQPVDNTPADLPKRPYSPHTSSG